MKQNNLNKINDKKQLEEEEEEAEEEEAEAAERKHIFEILRHAKRNEPFAAEHPVVPPAFRGDGKGINRPQPPPFRINVEDKLAGRDSANENHQFFEVPQEMIGQNLEDSKDGGEQIKKNQKRNRRQKVNRNHAFDNGLMADEKELQMQHPNDFDGNKKSQGLNNDDQYYDEEEDDTYQ